MNFIKDGINIKLKSIMDNGEALDITGYTDKGLLTIGDDGKYTGTSIEPSGTEESGNNEVNSNNQEDNEVITATSNNSGDSTTDEVESPNKSQVALQTGGKTKRRKAGKKNKSKRVRFMSKRNRRR
jgi:hypothetical protein